MPITAAISLPSCSTPLPALFRSFQSLLGARHNRLKKNNARKCPFHSNLMPNSNEGTGITHVAFVNWGRAPRGTLLRWKDGTGSKTKISQRDAGLARSCGHRAVSAHVASPVINSPTPGRRTLKANCQTLAWPKGLIANSAVAPTLKWLTKG